MQRMKCSQRILFTVVLITCGSHHARSAEFFGLGVLPGYSQSVARAVSDDGSVVAGFQVSNYEFGFRWTRETGMQELDPAAEISSRGDSVSGDGRVIAGIDWPRATNLGSAFYWTEAIGRVGIGPVGSRVYGASADGSTLVGWVNPEGPYRWTAETGLVPLRGLGSLGNAASDVSADGSVVVGPGGALTRGYSYRAWRWTAETGMIRLEPNVYSTALAISGDGSVVVGFLKPGGEAGTSEAFRWTEQTGMVALQASAIGASSANGVSGDGSVIVGNAVFDTARGNEAFIWTVEDGMRPFKDVLINDFKLSDNVVGWGNLNATAVSSDGSTIVGAATNPNGVREAWYAELRSPLHSWIIDSSGNWSAAGNWTPGVPKENAEALLGGIITAPRTVTVDLPITLSRIRFDSNNAYTLIGTNAVTMDAKIGKAKINVAAGSHTIAAPLTLADNTVIDVTPATSNLSITGALNASGRNLTKAGAGTLTLTNVRAAALSINGGNVSIAPDGTAAGTSALASLSIAGATSAWTAKLDLTNNDAIVQSSTANKSADFARLYNQIKQGFNNGTWQGLGITSATAAANPAADTGLSIVDNVLLGRTDFSGQPVTADSILLKYTYYGDIDQNGQVDADDLTVFATNFGRSSGPTQIDGDIDFNGAVNADDLTVFANNFNKGVGNPLAAANVQAVPEPGTWLLATCAVVALLLIATNYAGA